MSACFDREWYSIHKRDGLTYRDLKKKKKENLLDCLPKKCSTKIRSAYLLNLYYTDLPIKVDSILFPLFVRTAWSTLKTFWLHLRTFNLKFLSKGNGVFETEQTKLLKYFYNNTWGQSWYYPGWIGSWKTETFGLSLTPQFCSWHSCG